MGFARVAPAGCLKRFVVLQGGVPPPPGLPLSASLLTSQKALSRCRQILIAHGSSTSSAPHSPAAATATSGTDTAQAVREATEAAAVPEQLQQQQHQYDACIGKDTEAARPAEDVAPAAAAAEPCPAGYIVPGCPSDHDLDVAVKLGLPLLGPTPQLARTLASRIGSR